MPAWRLEGRLRVYGSTDIDLGIVNIRVGFVQLEPIEFVVMRLRRIATARLLADEVLQHGLA